MCHRVVKESVVLARMSPFSRANENVKSASPRRSKCPSIDDEIFCELHKCRAHVLLVTIVDGEHCVILVNTSPMMNFVLRLGLGPVEPSLLFLLVFMTSKVFEKYYPKGNKKDTLSPFRGN